MIKVLYNWLSSMDMFLVMFFIIKYIFLKLCNIKKKTFIKMMVIVCIAELAFQIGGMFNEGISVLGTPIILAVMIFKFEKKNKIKSIFVIIPTFIIILNIIIVFMLMGYIITGSFEIFLNDDYYYTSVIDIICWTGIILFLVRGKNLRNTYDEVIKNKSRDKYEKLLLNIANILSLVSMVIAFMIDELSIATNFKKLYMFLILIVMIALDLNILGMISQRNKKFYYQTLSNINEYYLKTQIDHFRNYQIQQRETRRIKHDMKNHMIVLNNLAENGKLEDIKEYISKLKDDVFEIDNEIHTGNEIVDAIVNEKSAKCENQDIKISFDGIISNDIKVSAIDLCTIFSNALDNAIEYLEKSDIKDRNIYVSIISNNLIHMITFKNKVSEMNKDFVSTKDDKLNHGFGIENIKRSAEKYNGEIHYKITDDYNFILEVMLCE